MKKLMLITILVSLMATPALASVCTLKVTMEACVSAPPSSGDDCKGKVISMELEYTGGGCGASSHSQKTDKVKCSGDPLGTAPVSIYVTGGRNGEKVWGFAENLLVGGEVSAYAANAGKNNLDAETTVTIIDEFDDCVLQEVKFHTSCSQPLSVGDQFGGVKVISMTTTEGGTVTSSPDGSCITELPGSGGPFDVEYTYNITNTSFFPVTNVTVVDDIFDGPVPGSPIASIGAGEEKVLTAIASLSEATTNKVVVTADQGCFAEASAKITKAPPEPEKCTTKIHAMLLEYIGATVSGPVTVTIKADKFKDDLVSYNISGDLVSGTTLSSAAENDWTIDATEHTTTDRRGNVKQCVELGANTKISINGITEKIHTSCSTPFVSGQPAPLGDKDVKGDPSPNWFVVDFCELNDLDCKDAAE